MKTTRGDERRAKEQRREAKPRRAVLIVKMLACLLTLMLPAGYVLAHMWLTTADAVRIADTERVGVAYVRPLASLLATLVDAQSAAARGVSVDAAAVRSAVEDVSGANRSYGDRLLARQRWEPVPGQIELA